MTARIVSALVLVPLTLSAVYLGGVYLLLLVSTAAAIMSWEWLRLVGGTRAKPDPGTSPHRSAVRADQAGALGVGLALLAAGLTAPVLGAGLAIGVSAAIARLEPRAARPWVAGGLLWIALPSVGFLWLRNGPAGGTIAAWLLSTVWATDTCAYIFGRWLKGPKLIPRISPEKTWAGLGGGIAGAAAVGAATGLLTAPGHWCQIAGFGALLAVVEQAGDLAESYAKRRFGAKDSSRLIPGHGGLLDRLDGMLAVIAAVVLLDLALGIETLTGISAR